MRIQMAGATDVGRRRKSNQDSFYFDNVQGLAIVADGIGGRTGGEIASKLAVDGMKKSFLETDCIRHEEITTFLSSAIDNVNTHILQYAEINPEKSGMGTTLNCLMFVSNQLHIAHLGDSRTYLFFKDHLWQLTIDHNVETFLERGWMAKEQITPGTKEGALVKSLGMETGVEADIYTLMLQVGQIFITCSDGLTNMVSDQRIARLINEYSKNIDILPKILINEANKNGGKDNITVVVSKVSGV